MRRWWLVIPLLLSVGINVGILVALASGRLAPDRRPPVPTLEGPRSGQRSMGSRLGVDQQIGRELGRLQREFFDSTQQQRQRIGALRRRLIEEVTAAQPNPETLEEILLELSEARLEMERVMVSTTLGSRALLDEDQEERYLRQWRQRMTGRGDGRPLRRLPNGGPGRPPRRDPRQF